MLDNNFHSEEAEQIVLGTILASNIYYKNVSDTLHSFHFFFTQNQAIFEKIEETIKKGSVADIVTLKDFSESEYSIKAIGGVKYLSALMMLATGTIDIRDYANLIVDNYHRRGQREIYTRALEELNSGNSIKVADDVLEKLSKMENESEAVAVFDGADMAKALQEAWKKELTPIDSGIPTLNNALNGGFYPKKLYIIGAAPGAGKTSLAQQIILNALKKDISCLFFSMEMEKENIITRFFSAIAKINPFRILLNKIYTHEQERFNNACEMWDKFKHRMFIVEKGGLSMSQIKATAKRIKRKHNIGLVVVDYIQIMQTRDSKNFNEAALIKENITALKDLAKELGVAAIALSQITKDSLGERPGLKALKGSGGIGEGADSVINLWSNIEKDQEEQAVKKLNIEIAKNRNGPCKSWAIDFNGEYGIFTEDKGSF